MVFTNTLNNELMSYGAGSRKLADLETLCGQVSTVYVSWWGTRRVTVNGYHGSVSLDKLACAFSSFLEQKAASQCEEKGVATSQCEEKGVATSVKVQEEIIIEGPEGYPLRQKTEGVLYRANSLGYEHIKKLYRTEVPLSKISKVFIKIRSIWPFQTETPLSYLEQGSVLFHKHFHFKFQYA